MNHQGPSISLAALAGGAAVLFFPTVITACFSWTLAGVVWLVASALCGLLAASRGRRPHLQALLASAVASAALTLLPDPSAGLEEDLEPDADMCGVAVSPFIAVVCAALATHAGPRRPHD